MIDVVRGKNLLLFILLWWWITMQQIFLQSILTTTTIATTILALQLSTQLRTQTHRLHRRFTGSIVLSGLNQPHDPFISPIASKSRNHITFECNSISSNSVRTRLLRQKHHRCVTLSVQMSSSESNAKGINGDVTEVIYPSQMNEDSNIDEAEKSKWEKLYRAGGSTSNINTLSNVQFKDVPCCEIRVVSFDLDNTLWNTSKTIDVANDALAQYINEVILQTFNNTGTVRSEEIRVEKVMGKLFAANKVKYAPIDGENARSPVLLTQLRKDAIYDVLRNYLEQNQLQNDMDNSPDNFLSYDDQRLQNIVDMAFDVWVTARHDAISQSLCASTTYVMDQIKSLRMAQPTTKVLIGAITDGNSNPKLIPALSDVFDFYVNAEMVGIGKPNKRIYLHAAKQVFTHHATLFKDICNLIQDDMTEDDIEDSIGPWWVHIGDDFVKDIVASNELMMRNIWTKELLVHPEKTKPIPQQQTTLPSQPFSDEKLIQEMMNEDKIITMSIGAETYLADSISNEFATATVQKLSDIVDILQQWQNQALSSSSQSNPDNAVSGTKTGVNMVNQNSSDDDNDSNSSQSKFCTSCGTKLPCTAKFCSSCGQRQ